MSVSGAMYENFPFTTPICVLCVWMADRTMPKSMSFTAPETDSITFCGVTSRWTTPSERPSTSRRLCACSSAAATPMPTCTTLATDSGRRESAAARTTSSSVCPWMYSIAR